MDEPFGLKQDLARRPARYQKVAAEYEELAGAATSPFLREYFQRIAANYHEQAAGELYIVEQEGVALRERAPG
jgi:hypothetical protein